MLGLHNHVVHVCCVPLPIAMPAVPIAMVTIDRALGRRLSIIGWVIACSTRHLASKQNLAGRVGNTGLVYGDELDWLKTLYYIELKVSTIQWFC